MRKASKGLLLYVLFFVAVDVFNPSKCVATGVRSTIACENGMVFINCPSNTVVITIAEATYGRDLSKKFVCQSEDPNVVIKDCGVSNVKTRVKTLCEGKSECTFTANNKNLGAFCTNVYKYLIILYDCIPRPSTKKPTTGPPTTFQVTSPIKETTTSRTTTRILEQSTITFTNFTEQDNYTNYNESNTTERPEPTEPIEGLGQIIPLTIQPGIDAYDREIFKVNHGTICSSVSGSFVTLSLLVITFNRVFWRVT